VILYEALDFFYISASIRFVQNLHQHFFKQISKVKKTKQEKNKMAANMTSIFILLHLLTLLTDFDKNVTKTHNLQSTGPTLIFGFCYII